MPELPEIETIRRQLSHLIIGKTISSVEVLLKKSFIGNTKDIIGKKIVKIDRKGKVLILSFRSAASVIANESGECGNLVSLVADRHVVHDPVVGTPRNDRNYLYVHLRMSGQLVYPKPSFKRSILLRLKYLHKHLRVVIHFTDHSQLHFIDQRTFGFITANSSVIPKGIDALSPDLTVDKLSEILKSSNRPIKQILLDQNLIAGIGNIYASEILWESKINPKSKGNQIATGGTGRYLPRNDKVISHLHFAIRKILTEAIKFGGSTMSDRLYRQVKGEIGGYQKRFKVYDRKGEACFRCKASIKKIKQAQRSTYFCPKCQKLGKKGI